jgi:hypothetical protein
MRQRVDCEVKSEIVIKHSFMSGIDTRSTPSTDDLNFIVGYANISDIFDVGRSIRATLRRNNFISRGEDCCGGLIITC